MNRSDARDAWETARTRVEPVRMEACDALAALFRECADVQALDPTFAPVEVSEVRALIEESEGNESAARGFRMCSIEPRDGDVGPIGYFHYREDTPRVGIVALTIFLIRPSRRARGLGREVAAAFLDRLASDSTNRAVWARVFLANLPALEFWMRLGFRRVVQHKGVFVHESEPGRASVILECPLDGSEAPWRLESA